MKRSSDIQPRMLTKERAAAYCGVSAPAFAALCPILPIAMGADARLLRWDRKALDAWLDTLSGFEPAGPRPTLAELRKQHQAREASGLTPADAAWIDKAERELAQPRARKRRRTD